MTRLEQVEGPMSEPSHLGLPEMVVANAATGFDLPSVMVTPPGPVSRHWLDRARTCGAPMGPGPRPEAAESSQATGIVYTQARGANVIDADGNRFVDLAGGFGAMLLGHCHERILQAVQRQSARLFHALGDVHPSDVKIALSEELQGMYPERGARIILGQSGADALAAALKSAQLATGRSGWVSFHAAYHGLGYGPLALCGLRDSYAAPFREQLNPHVTSVPYPSWRDADESLEALELALGAGHVGAVVIEPVLGRGGIVPAAPGALARILEVAHRHGALLVADEVWTGLGRSGQWLYSVSEGCVPDLICLGKGLGGGLPVSACIGRGEVMRHWRQPDEVVHTATFAGAPLACAAALETLSVIREFELAPRSRAVGAAFLAGLREALAGSPAVSDVRGAGLMVGVQLAMGPGAASVAMDALLKRGYIVSTGGGRREVIVLTPALNIQPELLEAFIAELRSWLQDRGP